MEESSTSDDLKNNIGNSIDYDPMIISNTPSFHPLSLQPVNCNISSSNSNIPHQKISFSKCSSTYSSISINTITTENSMNTDHFNYKSINTITNPTFDNTNSNNINTNNNADHTNSNTNQSCNILNNSNYFENNNNNNNNNIQHCNTNLNHTNIRNSNKANINNLLQLNNDNDSRSKYMRIKNILNDNIVHCNFHPNYSPTITKINNLTPLPNKRKLSLGPSFNSKKISFKSFLGSNHTYAINNNRSYITLKNSRKRVKIK